MAAVRAAVAAAVQLRAAVAVAEWGAQREAVEAADVPRLEAAVEAPDAPQEAEVEALGVRLEAVEALGALSQPEVKLGLPGARPMATLMVGPAAVSVG